MEAAGSARESGVDRAISRAVRENLALLQRTSEELSQAVADLVSACSSSRPVNALPPMLRAQTAAAALAAALEVLSHFVTHSAHSAGEVLDQQDEVRAVAVEAPAPPSPTEYPPPSLPTPMGQSEVAWVEPVAEATPVVVTPPPLDVIAPPPEVAPEVAPLIEAPQPGEREVAPAGFAAAPAAPAEQLHEPPMPPPASEPQGVLAPSLPPALSERVEASAPLASEQPAFVLPRPPSIPSATIQLPDLRMPLDEPLAPPPPEPLDSHADVLPRVAVEAAPPEPLAESELVIAGPVAAEATGFDVASLSRDEQELHRRANRVAKVSMQDVLLMRPEEVRLGRQNKDLCRRLRGDLDKARKEYERRFASILNQPVDYFHHWMVEILANGDPEALGEYPYPSPLVRS